MTPLHKLFLTLLNSLLILGCVTVMAFATYVIWSDISFALYSKIAGTGFMWLVTPLAIWAFWGDIKAIWKGRSRNRGGHGN